MDAEKFEQLVAKAVESLPTEIQDHLENIDIIVADEPTPEQKRSRRLGKNQMLLGLYEGIPLTKRTYGYTGVMPDKITIFQNPLEALCRSNEEIIEEVQRVVRHEIAHHFGISDDRLKRMGRY